MAMEITREPETFTRETRPEVRSETNGTVPLWLPTPLPRRFSPMTGDHETDVAVIGGGVVGLAVAYLCKHAGLRVVLLDARRVGGGESARTTAHVTARPDASWKRIVGDRGADFARDWWMEGMLAIEQLESIVRGLKVECGWRRVPSWLFTETESGRLALREEAEAAAAAGIPSRFIEVDVPLPWNVEGALRCEDQACLEPERLLTALADAVNGGGSHVFEDTPALEVHDGEMPWVHTEGGVVRARHVVVATHTPFHDRVLLQTKIAPYRTYVLALRSRLEIPDGLFWDDGDPYHYVRSTGVGAERTILVGGEVHRTGQDDDAAKRFEDLERWAQARLPGSVVQRAWSGQILEPVDGLPYVGRNALSQRVWEATGFSGNGWAHGFVAARILSAAVRGIEHPLAGDLAATRITPVAGAARYVRENAGFPWHYLVDRLKARPTDLESLHPGTGKLFMSRTMHPVAVYRDESGAFHVLSPKCPHLGCIVMFNSAERSWDCPCHGSRFSVDGQWLNGPATTGLRRIDPRSGAELDDTEESDEPENRRGIA